MRGWRMRNSNFVRRRRSRCSRSPSAPPRLRVSCERQLGGDVGLSVGTPHLIAARTVFGHFEGADGRTRTEGRVPFHHRRAQSVSESDRKRETESRITSPRADNYCRVGSAKFTPANPLFDMINLLWSTFQDLPNQSNCERDKRRTGIGMVKKMPPFHTGLGFEDTSIGIRLAVLQITKPSTYAKSRGNFSTCVQHTREWSLSLPH